VILGGGGVTHPAWRDLLEDVIGLPLTPAPSTWLTPAGAASLAAEDA
jgi:sugar (pentulose or hexulose) kinase